MKPYIALADLNLSDDLTTLGDVMRDTPRTTDAHDLALHLIRLTARLLFRPRDLSPSHDDIFTDFVCDIGELRRPGALLHPTPPRFAPLEDALTALRNRAHPTPEVLLSKRLLSLALILVSSDVVVKPDWHVRVHALFDAVELRTTRNN